MYLWKKMDAPVLVASVSIISGVALANAEQSTSTSSSTVLMTAQAYNATAPTAGKKAYDVTSQPGVYKKSSAYCAKGTSPAKDTAQATKAIAAARMVDPKIGATATVTEYEGKYYLIPGQGHCYKVSKKAVH